MEKIALSLFEIGRKVVRFLFKILLWAVIILCWIITACSLCGFAMSLFNGMVSTWQSTYNTGADLETWGVVLVSGFILLVSATVVNYLESLKERLK